MGEKDPKFLKTEFPDNNWKYLTKNLAYPYEYFTGLDDYQKPVDILKKQDFFSKLQNDYPSDEKKKEQKKLLNYSTLKLEKN